MKTVLFRQETAVMYLFINSPEKYTILVLRSNDGLVCANEFCAEGSIISDDNSGEVLCSSCGHVLVEKAEINDSDIRTYSMEEYLAKSKNGMKSSLAIGDMGLSTLIDVRDCDVGGNVLSSEMRSTFNRLRMWDARSKSDSSERSLRKAFVTINTTKAKLSISDSTVEKAAYFYRKILSKKMTRGRSIHVMALASLYLACRESNTPRTVQDIAKASYASIRSLSKYIRILIQNLDVKVESYDCAHFINRISSLAGLKNKTRLYAFEILEKTKRNGFADGKNPVALAATIVYLSSVANSEKITQRKIATISGISIVTIRNRYTSLVKSLMIREDFVSSAVA